jgi:hypothetical protein
MHAALAAYYEYLRVTNAPPKLDTLRVEFDEAAAAMDADPNTVSVQWCGLERYLTEERTAYVDWEVLGVEVPVQVTLANAVVLTAKWDLVVRSRRTGQRFVVDHKMSMRASTNNIDQSWGLSVPVFTALMCGSGMGGRVVEGWDGQVLDPDGADGVRPGDMLAVGYVWINEVLVRKDPPYIRGHSFTLSHDVAAGFVEALGAADNVVRNANNRAPMWGLLTGECGGHGVGQPCEYHDLCRFGDRVREMYEVVDA